jgi:hypothetical protein
MWYVIGVQQDLESFGFPSFSKEIFTLFKQEKNSKNWIIITGTVSSFSDPYPT